MKLLGNNWSGVVLCMLLAIRTSSEMEYMCIVLALLRKWFGWNIYTWTALRNLMDVLLVQTSALNRPQRLCTLVRLSFYGTVLAIIPIGYTEVFGGFWGKKNCVRFMCAYPFILVHPPSKDSGFAPDTLPCYTLARMLPQLPANRST